MDNPVVDGANKPLENRKKKKIDEVNMGKIERGFILWNMMWGTSDGKVVIYS